MVSKFIEFVFLKGILLVLDILPFQLVLYATKLIGRLLHFFPSKRRKLARENIRHAFPEKTEEWVKKIAYQSFMNIARLAGEFIGLRRLHNKKFFDQWVSFSPGKKEYRKILKRGGIFIMGHIGSWEWNGGAASILLGEEVYTFAKRQSNRWVNGLIEKRRNWAGMQLLYTDASSLKAFSLLKKNKVVTFISDQYAAGSEIYIPFMKRLASTFSGPAAFARSSASPVHFASSYRNKAGQLIIEIEPVERPSEKELARSGLNWEEFFTRRWVAVLERKIREHPADYFWVHDRWKNPPEDQEKIWEKWEQNI